MLRIALINMPFVNLNRPSLALTQLRSVLNSSLPDQVEARIFYLNFDFAEFLGIPNYNMISSEIEAVLSGLGDFLFARIAFPDAPDRSDQYFRRYARVFGSKRETVHLLAQKRESLDSFFDQLIKRHGLDQFDIVGMTSMFQQNLASLAMARKLKQHNPNIITVMGGPNCETPMGQVLVRNFEQLDFAFSGPALRSFPEFVRRIIKGQREQCDRIQGVFSRARLARGKVPDEVGEELDINTDIPLEYEDYFATVQERFPATAGHLTVLFETSRGCWWGQRAHCTFCGLNGLTMDFKAMRPAKALKQFETLFRYSSRAACFEAVDNIMPKEYLTELFPHLKSPRPIFYEVKADLKDAELSILARSGIKFIQPGIEALTTPTLRLMKKGVTAFQNLKFLKSCVHYDIRPVWNLLLGFPGQEEACYEKCSRDLPLFLHLPPPGGAHMVRFIRFSPYFNLAKEYGLKLKPYDFYSLLYPLPEPELADLAYWFYDENISAPYLQLAAKWVPRLREQVNHWHTRWSQRDGKLKPELHLVGEGAGQRVYDSRSGTAMEHQIDSDMGRILRALSSPLSMALLGQELKDLSPETLTNKVGYLKARGLIFEEGDRIMSLVMENDPSVRQKTESAPAHFSATAATAAVAPASISVAGSLPPRVGVNA